MSVSNFLYGSLILIFYLDLSLIFFQVELYRKQCFVTDLAEAPRKWGVQRGAGLKTMQFVLSFNVRICWITNRTAGTPRIKLFFFLLEYLFEFFNRFDL